MSTHEHSHQRSPAAVPQTVAPPAPPVLCIRMRVADGGGGGHPRRYHPVMAFVDTGACSSSISAACAERCGLSVDATSREQFFCGVSQIPIMSLGKTNCFMDIGESRFDWSLDVTADLYEGPIGDILLGWDLLVHLQATIDLSRLELGIGTSGHAVPFLSASEISRIWPTKL